MAVYCVDSGFGNAALRESPSGTCDAEVPAPRIRYQDSRVRLSDMVRSIYDAQTGVHARTDALDRIPELAQALRA